MLNALLWAAAGTGFTALMTALGAAVVFLFRHRSSPALHRVMLGFAAGVMIAASMWSLLIPAIEKAQEQNVPGWLPAAVGLGVGAMFLGAVEEFLNRLERKKHADECRQGALLMTAITLHNIPEGMAVGLAFAMAAEGEGFAGAAALALGIGVQNFPEGAAIALPLAHQGRGRRYAFGRGVLSGVVEPVFGAAVVLCAGTAAAVMPWLLSFAAGAMLYVVVQELVPQAHSRGGSSAFVVGFLAMMVLDVALG